MARDVTIGQVAQAAGVARSSVSRAFTKPHLLSASTVARVLQVAEELGYRPNQAARALTTGRNGNIALIIPDVANPFFPPMIRAAQQAAMGSDLCAFLGDSNEDPAVEARLIERFIGQVDGLVVASSRLPDEALRAFSALRPLVLINRDVEGLPSILIDSSKGVAEAVAHLVALGHRRIAYIAGPATSWSNMVRRRACMAACDEWGLGYQEFSVQSPSYAGGLAMVEAVLGAQVTGLIVFDDITAHGLMSGLMQRGVFVPEHMSIIGCDDVLGHVTNPQLSSVSSPTAEAGALAVGRLTDLLNGISCAEPSLLDTGFVQRETTSRNKQ